MSFALVLRAGQEADISLKLTGDYDEKTKKWTNAKLSVPTKSDFATTQDLQATLNLSKVGSSAKYATNTSSRYYFIIDGDIKKLKPQAVVERMPDTVAKATGLPFGSTWPVLKGELQFTVVHLSKKHLDATFQLRKSGLTLVSGATVEATQSGKMTVNMVPIKGDGSWVRGLISFGGWTASTKGNAKHPGWALCKGTEEVTVIMGATGNKPKWFDPDTFGSWFNTK